MTASSVGDYIKVYADGVSSEFHNKLLAFYTTSVPEKIDLDWRRCERVCITPEHGDLHKFYKLEMGGLLARYKKEVDVPTLGHISRIEGAQIFKYAPSSKKNHFNLHGDAWNGESATRQVSIIVYLTTVEKGGETRFPKLGISVKPVARQALVFPSSWQFEHLALPPESGPKIVLVSWFHYGPNTGYQTYPL